MADNSNNHSNMRGRRINPQPQTKFTDEQGPMRGGVIRSEHDYSDMTGLTDQLSSSGLDNIKAKQARPMRGVMIQQPLRESPGPRLYEPVIKDQNQFIKPVRPAPPPKELNSAFQSNNVVLISGDVDDTNLAQKVVESIYGCYAGLRIDYKKKEKEYKVQGSYIWAEDLCSFEAQLWKIPAKGNGKNLAYELKKKSMMGDVAFTDLVQKVAWHLKENGLSTVMADNEEILRPMTQLETTDEKINEFDDFGDFNESDFDDSGLEDCPDTPLSMLGSPNAVTGIRLNSNDDDLIRHWERILSMGDYGLLLDTLKTISRAAKHKDNAKVLAAKQTQGGILDRAVNELSKVKDPQIVHTALSLVYSIIQSGNETASRFLCEHNILAILTNIFLTFTGNGTDKKAKKVQSNPVVAEASLNIMNCLTDAESGSGSIVKKFTSKMKKALSDVETSNKVKDQYVKSAMKSLHVKLGRIGVF